MDKLIREKQWLLVWLTQKKDWDRIQRAGLRAEIRDACTCDDADIDPDMKGDRMLKQWYDTCPLPAKTKLITD
ncbi:hypothetical protein Tco_0699344 [Tanacetum coccineum]